MARLYNCFARGMASFVHPHETIRDGRSALPRQRWQPGPHYGNWMMSRPIGINFDSIYQLFIAGGLFKFRP